jgi:predicted nucleic acid-binding protein
MKKTFLDTNIIAYNYDDAEPDKCLFISDLLVTVERNISTQVFSELANLLSKKFKFSWSAIAAAHSELNANFTLHLVTAHTIAKAVSLAERYKYSYYDSLILASAIEAQCEILYSEDFQHNQLIEGVRIINPFL